MNKIIIGADFVPTESNEKYFVNNQQMQIFDDKLIEILNSDNYKIFNLEMPLCNTSSPIDKNGPCLMAKEETINLYKALNIDLFTIGNNHILDQGENNLLNTINLLKKYNINYVGAGENLCNLKKSFTFELNNKKIGVYACVEHEFSIATENNAGANPFDPYYSFDEVEELKKTNDYVIVLYHGGKEEYRYPTPLLQKTCRRFVEKGADLVVCQHSHCIGCEENYQTSKIIYGQGNFLFDLCDEKCWQTCLLIEVDVENNFNINYIPCVKKGEAVNLASNYETKQILEEFNNRSLEILKNNFVEKKYNDLLKTYSYQFNKNFLGKIADTFIFRAINKITKGKVYEKIYTKDKCLAIENLIDCETHREGILRFLTHKSNTEEKL